MKQIISLITILLFFSCTFSQKIRENYLFLDGTYSMPGNLRILSSATIDGGLFFRPELGMGMGYTLNFNPDFYATESIFAFCLRGTTFIHGGHGFYYRFRIGDGRVDENLAPFSDEEKDKIKLREFYLGKQINHYFGIGLGLRNITRIELPLQRPLARYYLSPQFSFFMGGTSRRRYSPIPVFTKFNQHSYFYLRIPFGGFGIRSGTLPEISYGGGMGWKLNNNLGVGIQALALYGLSYQSRISQNNYQLLGVHLLIREGKWLSQLELSQSVGFKNAEIRGLDSQAFRPNHKFRPFFNFSAGRLVSEYVGIQLSFITSFPIKGVEVIRTYDSGNYQVQTLSMHKIIASLHGGAFVYIN